ncbi:MAG: M20/M25/M40 family metallo-hydrolase [Mycoplasmoidaceae bacterium]
MILDEVLEQIKSEALKEFELLSKVYRPSFETRKIADYLKQRVKELRPNIEVYEDCYRANLIDDACNPNISSGNIWFDLPATPGLEKNEPIILQAHMDMVCAYANDQAAKQMKESGVQLEYHDNGTLTSMGNQTSLGADNGMGIGVMLAILKNDTLKHGLIRFLITTDEEVGMCGASYLGLNKNGEKGSPVQGFKYLINLDDPYDGEIIVSTAGAVVSLYTVPLAKDYPALAPGLKVYTLDINGLLGGHDGVEIHHHASAARVAAQILNDVNTTEDFTLIEFTTPGCDFHNVIQTRANVTFATSLDFATIQKIIEHHEAILKNEYPLETNAKIKLEVTQLPNNVEIKPIPHDISSKILKLITSLPYGPTSWKNKSTGWVETSGNVGPINLLCKKHEENGKTLWDQPTFDMRAHTRSCNNEHLVSTVEQNKKLAKDIFGSDDLDYYQLKNVLYGWPGDEDTTLLDVAKTGYEAKGVKWSTKNVHGGFEVSWFKHFNDKLVMVIIGPEIHDIHQPQETLYTGTLDGFIYVVLSCIEKMVSISH